MESQLKVVSRGNDSQRGDSERGSSGGKGRGNVEIAGLSTPVAGSDIGGIATPVFGDGLATPVAAPLDLESPSVEAPLPPPLLPPPSPVASVTDSVAAPSVAGSHAAKSRILPWASFNFSRKRSPPYGAIEARCRFHVRNEKTGCKRLIRCMTDDDEGERRALITLYHWCNQARTFDRQWKHIAMPLAWTDIPPEALVREQRLDDVPPEKAATDVELDAAADAAAGPGGGGALEAEPMAAPKAEAKGKAGPKTGAQAKGRGRGGGRGRGRAAEAVPPPPAVAPASPMDEVGPDSSEESQSESSSDSSSSSDSDSSDS